ncbi:MAG: UvrD-helicase domain-containing protein, partial [Firmicutes bacterium]|nr:UvrD-helicase domain-containing protein [Bacillota bacterium]
MAREWTEKQREAIEDRGNDLLVSAAAGSGKTAVLVERITQLILRDRVPVTNMLVVTFTKAAASEMRERIHRSLRDALAEAADPETEEFLRTQVSDLPRASISNFHSFASSLLREHFAVAGVDPAFRVADEIRADLLKGDALDDLFELRFAETGTRKEAFLSYLRSYASSRSEDRVKAQIRKISDFLDSLPDPEGWLRAAATLPGMSREEFLSSPFYRFALEDASALLADAEQAADELVALFSAKDVYRNNLLPLATSERDAIRKAREAFGRSLDEGREAVNAISFARFSAKAAEKADYAIDGPYGKRLRAVYHETSKSRPGLVEQVRRTYAMRSAEDALTLIRGTAEATETLTELVREFRALYRARKDAEKLLDFADLESYALAVLSDEPTRDALRARYRYLFVDEYQDSNRVQEDLIKRLKSPSERLFCVGDIKQSIYGFRLAEPAIFGSRMALYRASSANEKTIDLNRNFRSEGSILTAINALFEGLMEPTVSGIAYDETQALVPGTEAAANARTPVELHLIDARKPE